MAEWVTNLIALGSYFVLALLQLGLHAYTGIVSVRTCAPGRGWKQGGLHLIFNILEPLLDICLCLCLVLRDEARPYNLENGIVGFENREFLGRVLVGVGSLARRTATAARRWWATRGDDGRIYTP
jgi:hypothetical protein